MSEPTVEIKVTLIGAPRPIIHSSVVEALRTIQSSAWAQLDASLCEAMLTIARRERP